MVCASDILQTNCSTTVAANATGELAPVADAARAVGSCAPARAFAAPVLFGFLLVHVIAWRFLPVGIALVDVGVSPVHADVLPVDSNPVVASVDPGSADDVSAVPWRVSPVRLV